MDITSANAKIILTVDELYPSGIKLEKFSADSSVSSDERKRKEARMSVDGKIAVGKIYSPHSLTISFEADSPSIKKLNNISNLEDKLGVNYVCHLHMTVPSIGIVRQYKNGAMMSVNDSDLKSVLGPQSYTFSFESMNVTEI